MSVIATEIEIKDFRGVRAVKEKVGPMGIAAEGRSDSGKTSFVDAWRALLGAVGVGPEAIRIGAEKAEIFVDFTEFTAKRTITPKGSTLKVTKDGFEKKAPQAFLNEYFGTAAIDPLDLMLAKPKDRRSVVLSALPVTVTREQLDAWAPGLPESFSTDGHGLDVVKRAHEYFYERRTAANASAKVATTEAERLAGLVGQVPDACSLAEAVEAFRVAQTELATAEAEARSFLASQDRARESTEKASKLQVEADEIVVGNVDALRANADEAARIVHELTAQLEKAKDVWGSATLSLNKAAEGARRKESLGREIAALLQSAPVGTMPDVNAARVKLETAESAGKAARARDEAIRAKSTADAAKVTAEKATAEAKVLDKSVKALADAPAALLEKADGLPGLSLAGDDVAIDGVPMATLSGIKKTKACVAIAKRINAHAKGKILIVDGLERIDEDAIDAFVAEATADGWQLIASRVLRGDIRYTWFRSAEEAAAAE